MASGAGIGEAMTVTAQPSVHGTAAVDVPYEWSRRHDGRAVLALFLVALTLYLLTASYTINQVNDTQATALSAWSVGTRWTFALPAQWPEEVVYWARPGVDGRTYTDRFPGPILWAAPFYSVTELVVPRGTPAHPYLANFAPAGVAAAFAAAGAVCVAFLLFRRSVGRRLALLAAASLAFTTGMWSVASGAMWTHGVGSLFLLLGVLGTSTKRYGWAGAAFGFAILCRPQYAVIPAVIGLWEALRHRDLAPVLKIGALSGLGLGAMSVYSRIIFGTWLPVAGYETFKVGAVATRSPSAFAENVVLALVHPLRGILLYTPILLLLLPGLDRGWKAAAPWVRSSAIAGLIYAVVQLRANSWTGGADFFGNRLLLETLVLASPLLVLTAQRYLLPAKHAIRVVAASVLVISAAFHALGATVIPTGFYGADGVTMWQDQIAEFCREEPDLCLRKSDPD
jgi:hypothetical protein